MLDAQSNTVNAAAVENEAPSNTYYTSYTAIVFNILDIIPFNDRQDSGNVIVSISQLVD